MAFTLATRASRWASMSRGSATAARMPMMLMTMISSIRVKPRCRRGSKYLSSCSRFMSIPSQTIPQSNLHRLQTQAHRPPGDGADGQQPPSQFPTAVEGPRMPGPVFQPPRCRVEAPGSRAVGQRRFPDITFRHFPEKLEGIGRQQLPQPVVFAADQMLANGDLQPGAHVADDDIHPRFLDGRLGLVQNKAQGGSQRDDGGEADSADAA